MSVLLDLDNSYFKGMYLGIEVIKGLVKHDSFSYV